jgi:allantoin racemase
MDKQLQEALEVPVLDGVVCALKLLEGLIGYGVSTSKKRAYAKPNHKPIDGISKIFEKVYR